MDDLLEASTLQLISSHTEFSHVKSRPLSILTDVLAEYIDLLARKSSSKAALSHRSAVNVYDVLATLRELGTDKLEDLSDVIEEEKMTDDSLTALAGILIAPSDAIDMSKLIERRLTFAPVPDEVLLDWANAEESSSDESIAGDAVPMDVDPAELSAEPSVDKNAPGLPSSKSPTAALLLPGLPPLPGLEPREKVVTESVQEEKQEQEKKQEQQDEIVQKQRQLHRQQLRQRRRLMNKSNNTNSAAHANPWLAPIAYEQSTLYDADNKICLPSIKRTNKKGKATVSPSSLPSYNFERTQVRPELYYMTPSAKRRAAAAVISISPDMSLHPSSLFGGIPIPVIRQSKLPQGYLPETISRDVLLHPFNSSLPKTMTVPLPNPLSNAPLTAPTPHPRIPQVMQSVKNHLAPSNLLVFSRLTRMAPPGPIGPKGEPVPYEFDASNTVVNNIEVTQRRYNEPLSLDDPRVSYGKHKKHKKNEQKDDEGEQIGGANGEVNVKGEGRVNGEANGEKDIISTEPQNESRPSEQHQNGISASADAPTTDHMDVDVPHTEMAPVLEVGSGPVSTSNPTPAPEGDVKPNIPSDAPSALGQNGLESNAYNQPEGMHQEAENAVAALSDPPEKANERID